MTTFLTSLLFVASMMLSSLLVAADDTELSANPPESATREQGLAAFERIVEVALHPRCANCHVGDDNIPMWSGPSLGKTRPHDMNINAGASRIGAETLLCSSCHRSTDDLAGGANAVAGAAPGFGIAWQLAPVEFVWFGRTPQEICEQLIDPERNGGRDWQGLVDHLIHDASLNGPVRWGWQPGGEREPAPYSLQQHIDDMAIWGVAGQPCPNDQTG